jgi:hypothetical protein
MIEREDVVAAVLAAAGGTLTGRVRLQKAVYLLKRLGFESGFDFEYHHYGPYSRELDNAVADAKALGVVGEEFEHRQSDGAQYSVFRLTAELNPEVSEVFPPDRVGKLMHLFARTNVTVLELAATANWLVEVERSPDWQAEITRRKGIKVQAGRLDRALALLADLQLAPAV